MFFLLHSIGRKVLCRTLMTVNVYIQLFYCSITHSTCLYHWQDFKRAHVQVTRNNPSEDVDQNFLWKSWDMSHLQETHKSAASVTSQKQMITTLLFVVWQVDSWQTSAVKRENWRLQSTHQCLHQLINWKEIKWDLNTQVKPSHIPISTRPVHIHEHAVMSTHTTSNIPYHRAVYLWDEDIWLWSDSNKSSSPSSPTVCISLSTAAAHQHTTMQKLAV